MVVSIGRVMQLTTTPETQPKTARRYKLLVPVVILVGLFVGLASALNLGIEYPGNPYGLPPPDVYFSVYRFLQYHIILSTISLALLLSLMVVYSRSYSQTRANFMLGLLIVLFALFLQGLSEYPLLHLMVTGRVVIDTFYSPVADIFTIIAYSVFLYLSLE